MARHRTAAQTPWLTLSLLAVALLPAWTFAQLAVTSVTSRMTHGAAGVFDIPLPQTGAGGIECRLLSQGMTIVVTFDKPVTAGAVSVAAGTATAGTPAFNGNTMSIPLTAVANAQSVTLALSNVADMSGGTLASQNIFFRVLEGDINGTGSVTVGDVNTATFRASNNPVNYASFRADFDHSGFVSVTDTSMIKARVNLSVAGGLAVNTPPTISDIPNQSTAAGVAMTPAAFTIRDTESTSDMLYVSVTSSDATLVPPTNITVTGTGPNRTLNIAAALDSNKQPLTGTATITVSVSDGLVVTNDTFLLSIGSPSKLYVAILKPESEATVTPASGSATLLVDAAETQAILRFNYANLTTNKTGSHVHGPADPGQNADIIYDIDISTPQEDGSYVWTFQQAGNTTVQDIRDALHAGRLYLNIHSAKYPAGEIRGHFNFAAGSTTFTPPPPPPPLPSGPPTDQDAARFLTQASFGAAPDNTTDPNQTNHTIAAVKQLGFDGWLNNQFNAPMTPETTMKSIIESRITASTYLISASNITDAWWNLALKSPDQLRQRIALAYSEIFVVSKVEEAINGQVIGLASYHDMLAADAFANFRTLLKDVTLHPIMGQYLNMRGNKKPTSPNFTAPNENYAREVLQLFTIGLNNLHPDGTLKLDGNGLPIPTYDQDTIQNFAQVFTGWDTDPTAYIYSFWDTSLTPDALNTNGKSTYVRPMTVRPGNHANSNKTLLNGFVITGKSSYDVNSATAELDAALDNIFNHPNVGPFIARRLIQRLVTSNPSPAYIYRVAEVFRDNGQGVRGDMKAVIRAILTDYEARTTTLLGNEGYGRLKEPLLRTTQIVRAFHPYSNGATPAVQYWRLGSTDTEFLQTPYRSPTVFNFFEPDFVTSLTLTNPNPKPGYPTQYTEVLGSPEMQILNENTAITTANLFNKGLIAGTGFSNGTTDVRVLLDNENSLATAATGDNLVNYLNRLLMAGQMPTNMQNTLKTYYTSVTTVTPPSAANAAKRARGLIFLVAASPQFAVQK